MNDVRQLLNKYNFKLDKISLINNVKIVDTSNGKYVIKKKKNDDINELFRYLKSKGFHNYLSFINNSNDNYLIYPYINGIPLDVESKVKDIIVIIGQLHSKTSFYKVNSIDKIKEFYESQIKQIESLVKYYNDLRFMIEEQSFISPSNYYLLRNISWIFNSLNSSKYFLDKWYNTFKGKKNRRVCLIHGNLDFEHLLESDDKFLISWDKAHNDTPIKDLIDIYKKGYKYVSFYELFMLYEDISVLLPEEKYLLFSLILIPDKLNFRKSEILNMQEVYYLVKYLNTSNEIISNYHSCYANSQENKQDK